MVIVKKIGQGSYFRDACRVSFKFNTDTLKKINRLSERKYLPEDREWEIPVSELTELTELIGKSNIVIDGFTLDSSVSSLEPHTEKLDNPIENVKPIKEISLKTALMPHQIVAFNLGMTKQSLLIGDEQGLGKTIESIAITVGRKAELNKCLIVCGVNSVKYNWEEEIHKHSNEGCIIFDDRTMTERAMSINKWYRHSEYYGIINIESLRNPQIMDALYVGIKDGVIGAIIVDEIHKAKNGSSQQGKSLRQLKSKVKIGLTGTPIMSRAEDLWNILSWLGVEKRSFYSFRNTYCIMGGYGNYKVIGHKNLDSLNNILHGVMIRRKKEEVLDLPPKIHKLEYVELTHKQKMIYKDIKKGILENLEDILTTVNPLTSTLRLRQLTSGGLTEDNPKLDRIKEMLEDEIIPNGGKAIIFSQWSSIVRDYCIELKGYNPICITGDVDPEKRQKLVNEFQNKAHCKLAIGTIGAMGTGLTLNKASYVFFIDKAWTSGENSQAEDRAHRIGTAGTVTVISMIAKNTIDEGIEEYLRDNRELFDKIVEGKGSHLDAKELLTQLLKI